MIEGNNIFTTTIYFGKKDNDLSIWVQSIPKGLFSYHIRSILKAYLTQNENFIFPNFDIENIKPKNIYKPLSVPSDVGNKIVYDFVTALNSADESILGHKIKEIIRYYIQKNEYKIDIPAFKNQNQNEICSKKVKIEDHIIPEQQKENSKEEISSDITDNDEDNDLMLLLKQTKDQNG